MLAASGVVNVVTNSVRDIVGRPRELTDFIPFGRTRPNAMGKRMPINPNEVQGVVDHVVAGQDLAHGALDPKHVTPEWIGRIMKEVSR
jgi:hypothetical protein